MFRIKLKKVTFWSSEKEDYCSEYRYVIQKRFFIFWFRINNLSHSTLSNSEKFLEKHINNLEIENKKIKDSPPKYYLLVNDKILSGDSKKEVHKKSKLKAFL